MSRRHDIAYFDTPPVLEIVGESVGISGSAYVAGSVSQSVGESAMLSESDHRELFAGLTRIISESVRAAESPDWWIGLDAVTRAVQEAVGVDEPAGGGNWDVQNASHDGNFSVQAQDTSPSGVYFSPDGLRMYVSGNTGNTVEQYSLTDPFVITSGVTFVRSRSIQAEESSIQDVFFRPDGTRMYIIGQQRDRFIEFSLGTPWEINTGQFERWTSIRSQESVPSGFYFSPDGRRAYVIGTSSDSVNQYSLTTAWNVSTRTFVRSFSISAQEPIPTGVTFSPDGSRMYVIGTAGDDVNQYALSAAWNISTASFERSFSVSDQEISPTGIAFSPDGSKMFVIGLTRIAVQQYTLSADGGGAVTIDAMSALVSESIRAEETEYMMQIVTAILRILGETVLASESEYPDLADFRGIEEAVGASDAAYFDSADFRLASEAVRIGETEYLAGAVSEIMEEAVRLSDGTDTLDMLHRLVAESVRASEAAYVAGAVSQVYDESARIGEAEHIAASVSQIITEAARVGETEYVASAIVSVLRIIGEGIAVSETSYDETPVLAAVAEAVLAGETEYSAASTFAAIAEAVGLNEPAAWNLGTAIPDGSEPVPEERTPTSVYVSPDGTRMYVIGTSDDSVHQYDLTIAWDVTSATHVRTESVQDREGSPRDLFFRPDGSRMYVIGPGSDAVIQYDLGTAWDISTIQYSGEADVSGEDSIPVGVYVSTDGTRMYMTGLSTDRARQYALSTAWDMNSASYASRSLDLSAQDTNPRGAFFSPDGTRFFHTGIGTDAVYGYALGTAWDISTAESSGSYPVTQDGVPTGVFFRADGTAMYVSGNQNDRIYRYSLGGGIDTLDALLRSVTEALAASESALAMEVVTAVSRIVGEGIAAGEADVFYAETYAEIAEDIASDESAYALPLIRRIADESVRLSESPAVSGADARMIAEEIVMSETDHLLDILLRKTDEDMLSGEAAYALVTAMTSVAEAVAASESPGISGADARQIAEAAVMAEAAYGLDLLLRGIAEGLAFSESDTASVPTGLAVSEAVLAGETEHVLPVLARIMSESAGVSDARLTAALAAIAEGMSVSDVPMIAEEIYGIISETVSAAESEYVSMLNRMALAEGILSDDAAFPVPAELATYAEGMLATPTLSLTIPFSLSHSETFLLSDADDTLDALVRIASETAYAGESEYLSASTFASVAEAVIAAETAYASGTFGRIARIIGEEVSVSASVSSAATAMHALAEQVLAAETLHALGMFDTILGIVSEEAGISESSAIAGAVALAIAEAVAASESAYVTGSVMLSLAERVLASGDVVLRIPLSFAVSEGFRASESALTGIANLIMLSEQVRAGETAPVGLAIFLAVSEGMLSADSDTASVALVHAVSEGIAAAETALRNDFVTVISTLSKVSLNSTDARIYID